MRDAIVKTQNLKKYYQVGNQVVKALDGVDFAVREREFVAIIFMHRKLHLAVSCLMVGLGVINFVHF